MSLFLYWEGLYGWPMQVLVFHALGRQSPAVNFLCVLPLTLGCAWMSWRFVESPWRTRRAAV